MAALFERERSVIAKHIKNVFKEGELDSKVVCANFAHTTPHGAIKGKMQISEVVLYNLDVIISVGYRVKSIAETRFDGLALITDLVKSAKRSVVFIDPFATIEVLKFAAMRAKGVQAVVYSARITPEFRTAADLHNKQYPGLEPKTMRTIHDRFLLVDDKVYHFGASFIKYEGREQRQCLH